MNFFTVDLLTPNRVVAQNIPAESLLIPTVRGQINILPEHTHIIAQLAVGQISLFGGAGDPDRHFAASYGIGKVLGNKVTILSHTLEEHHEIDQSRAELALKHALDRLQGVNGSMSDENITKFHRKVERARLRIQLAKSAK